MTVRPFHLIRPLAVPRNIGWYAAVYFSIVAVLGAVPGIASLLFFGYGGLAAAVELNAGAAVMCGLFVAYIGFGFAQAIFYARRIIGKPDHAKFWWKATFVYNVPVASAAVMWFAGEPSVVSAGAILAAFVGLVLAVLASDEG